MALAQALASRRIYYGWHIVTVIFLAFFFSSRIHSSASATAVFLILLVRPPKRASQTAAPTWEAP